MSESSERQIDIAAGHRSAETPQSPVTSAVEADHSHFILYSVSIDNETDDSDASSVLDAFFDYTPFDEPFTDISGKDFIAIESAPHASEDPIYASYIRQIERDNNIPTEINIAPMDDISLDSLGSPFIPPSSVHPPDPILHSALYARETLMHEQDLSLSDTCARLHEYVPESNALASGFNTVAHCDGGSQVSTAPNALHLWNIRRLSIDESRIAMKVADSRVHRPVAIGDVLLKSEKGTYMTPFFLTPSITATLLSMSMVVSSDNQLFGYSSKMMLHGPHSDSCSLDFLDSSGSEAVVSLLCTLRQGMLWTDHLIAPSSMEERFADLSLLHELRANGHLAAMDKTLSQVPQPLSLHAVSETLTAEPVIENPPKKTVPPSPPSKLDLPIRSYCCCDDCPADPLAPSSTLSEFFDTVRAWQVGAYQLDVNLHHVVSSLSNVDHDDQTVPTANKSHSSCCCTASLESGEGICSRCPPEPFYHSVHHLTKLEAAALWHGRLGHLGRTSIAKLHRSVDGVPKLPYPHDIDTCPVCNKAKIHKRAKGTSSTRRATQCFQGLSLDFGIIVQASNDSSRLKQLVGLNGETCYLLIADHFSGMLFGEVFRSKAPPLDYLRSFLTRHAPDPRSCPDLYVRFDLGGELGQSLAVVQLFESFHYVVEPTARDSSNSNAPAERPHRTIGDALRAMLGGAGLDASFWPPAFKYYLKIYNCIPHGTSTKPPFEICSGQSISISHLRTFGCTVYVVPDRPAGRRSAKMISDGIRGRFLGFTSTSRFVLWYNPSTQEIGRAQHVIFDELDLDLPFEERCFNARLLSTARMGKRLDVFNAECDLPDLDVHYSPFLILDHRVIQFRPMDPDPLGLIFTDCSRLQRPFVMDFSRAPLRTTLKTARKFLQGAYIVSIDGRPVYTSEGISSLLSSLGSEIRDLSITFAPERTRDFDDRDRPLYLRSIDLLHISALLSTDIEAGEGNSSSLFRDRVSAFEDEICQECSNVVLHRLEQSIMTDEERQLIRDGRRFSRRTLMKLSNWDVWNKCFEDQLNTQQDGGIFGKPVLISSIPRTSNGFLPLFTFVWSNLVKMTGKRKCRCCLDGSPRAVPWLRSLVQTYSSCIASTGGRIFYSLCASLGYVILYGDAINAFQQGGRPQIQCYARLDDAFIEWYHKRFGTLLDKDKHCVPLEKTLQGHPEAGVIWERMIVPILKHLGFRAAAHEPNLYSGSFKSSTGKSSHVLLARQVDDFTCASKSQDTNHEFYRQLQTFIDFEIEGPGLPSARGLSVRFNGIEVHQTRDFILLNCERYITQMCETHGWGTPSTGESSSKQLLVPITDDKIKALAPLSGPPERTAEHKALEQSKGFGYRSLLGELLFAFVTVRIDIGFAICFLARFSTAPAPEHYDALRHICKFLRRTKGWGLVYWRQSPRDDLPVGLSDFEDDLTAYDFPTIPHDVLVGFADAAYASDIYRRRSVGGEVFLYSGAAIDFRSKLQPTTSVSSTEAEFLQLTSAAKRALYLRSIFDDLGLPMDDPTSLYIDNQAAIAMVMESKPTPRMRHIDTQLFAVQDWRADGHIAVTHIRGDQNPADDLTKALSWVLKHRHSRRMMGHYSRPSHLPR